MESQRPPMVELVDEDGRVAVDLPCVACGYNLRTLRVDGVCPECSAAVEPSLYQGRLSWADREWVETLAGGTVALAFSALLTFVFGGAAFAAALSGAEDVAACCFVLGLMAGGFFGVLGFFFVTEPEPHRRDGRVGLRWRRPARCGFAATIAVPIVAALITLAPLADFLRVGLLGIAAGALMLGPVATVFCLFRHLGDLMARVPNPRLAYLARLEAISLGLVNAVCLVIFAANVAIPVPYQVSAVGLIVVVAGSLSVVGAALAILFAAARVLSRVRRHAGISEKLALPQPGAAKIVARESKV